VDVNLLAEKTFNISSDSHLDKWSSSRIADGECNFLEKKQVLGIIPGASIAKCKILLEY